MMGRARSKSRAGWPDNLYPNRDGFKYRHPVTKKETWMGKDKAKAFAAARKLNALLVQGADLAARVLDPGKTVADAIVVFKTDDMPARNWAPKTAENYNSVINRIKNGFGDRDLATLTVQDCASFIRTVTESTRSRQQFRLVLGWILTCGVEEGWLENNPALVTRRYDHKRQRQRLTYELYTKVWNVAPAWLQVAMDLSLLTLLRREDVSYAKFAEYRDGFLWIVPGKTEGSTGVRLKIRLGKSGDELVARARDNVLSPFIVHKLPERTTAKQKRAEGREHHTQLMPDQITRGFQEARDMVGVKGKHAPSFHEIRSLGAALLRQQRGWSEEQVQALLAHSDVDMTRVYLEDHEQPWTEVDVGLVLER
ncbi:tyrosine-type recombinase/integrase [Lysobacter sp. ESA13C]|uniref:tyrosine-type recombinase/integrase n=1 Tax=Lysobacter sp. ESA13C TaxID=2862676 RepID=UPI001CC18909|nr:tyrosine-type recombinase/integrase [Lysobacter sp. ESA13C]